MADTNPSARRPAGWSEAFAALPLERAPVDAWPHLAATLAGAQASPVPARATRRYRARPVAFAMAASLLVALPMAWWLGTSSQAPIRDDSHSMRAVHAKPAATAPVGDRRPPTAVIAVPMRDAAPAAGVATAAQSVHAHPARRIAAPATTPATTQRIASAGTHPATRTIETREAHAATNAARTDRVADAGPALDGNDASARLAALREESARLEALVAHARDDRMASAPATVITAAVDDRIRLIDAALMQADVDAALRASLWDERVGALRELASLAGTQRWIAAQGASMDAVARVD